MCPRRPALVFLPLWLLGASGAALSLAWPLWPVRPPEVPATTRRGDEVAAQHPTLVLDMEFADDVPAVREPPARAAAEAGLDDGESVIGVTAGHRSRAYRVRALSHGAPSHVVNDVLGGVPVSVTHCDVYGCTRAFAGGTTGEPLDLAVGGVKPGGLILRARGHSYLQDSGAPLHPGDPPFPYDPHAAVVETWGAWRHEHPDTDVYVAAPGTTEKSPPLPSEIVPTPLPFDLPAAVASVVSVGIAPVLIGCVTALAHALLAYVLGPARRPPSGRRSRRAPGGDDTGPPSAEAPHYRR